MFITILSSDSSVWHTYFDDPTKLFLDRSIFDLIFTYYTSTKLFFAYKMQEIVFTYEKAIQYDFIAVGPPVYQ